MQLVLLSVCIYMCGTTLRERERDLVATQKKIFFAAEGVNVFFVCS